MSDPLDLATSLARANPDKSWRSIARDVGLDDSRVIAHLRSVLGAPDRETINRRIASSREKPMPFPLPAPEIPQVPSFACKVCGFRSIAPVHPTCRKAS